MPCPSTQQLQVVIACRKLAAAFDEALQHDADIRAAASAPLSAALAAAFASKAHDVSAILSVEAGVLNGGYQRWLVAPEQGLTRLLASALELYR